MGRFDRTFREVDGERVEGIWRPVFTRGHDGSYFLTDLKIYADGVLYCGDLLTFEEFAGQVRAGRIVTTVPDGARVHVHHGSSWTVSDSAAWLDEDGLVGEVADDIERLAGRPDSTDRCLAAVDVYRQDPTEANRTAVRAAYLAIPEHLRRYALGDMNYQDRPLRALVFDDEEMSREHALAYLADRARQREAHERRVPADGPEHSALPTVTIRGIVYRRQWPPDPGLDVLQNNYPAPITVGGHTYRTVIHAYWALSTADERLRAGIADTENPYQAQQLAEEAPRREGWADMRVAVMAALLRAKFRQHPDLAEVLLSTGDAQLVSNEYFSSRFWGQLGTQGRHWVARLLEVVRAELVAERAGMGGVLATP